MDFSIQQAARQHPARIALVSPQGSWTFHDIARASAELEDQIEGRLQGLMPKSASPPPVALLGEPRFSSLLALYALLELGVPVVLIHPRWTERERLRALSSIKPVLFLAGSQDCPESMDVFHVSGARETPLRFHQPPQNGSPAHTVRYRDRSPDPQAWMALLSTSGTSGVPKTVVLTREAFLASARANEANLGWEPNDRWLLNLPIAHVGGLSVITRCLAARRTVVLDAPGRFEPDVFAQTLVDYQISLASLVPTMLHRLLKALPDWTPPSTLRALLIGGAATPPALYREARQRGLPILTTYGLTETCSQVATQSYGSMQSGKLDAKNAGSGQALAGVRLRIRGGGIEVESDCLMEGYFPPPQLSSNPSSSPSSNPKPSASQPFTKDGWLVTGDLGHLDHDGCLHVLGRRGDLIISGGENVYPSEVEAMLREHPAISDACVFGVEDPEWGERVVSILVAEPEGPPRDEDLAAFCRQELATFKRPRSIGYLPAMPLRPNGKVDRQQVKRAAKAELRRLSFEPTFEPNIEKS